MTSALLDLVNFWSLGISSNFLCFPQGLNIEPVGLFK